MSVSYTKEQRAFAKENKLHLCTVAARGVEFQCLAGELKSRLIEDAGLHALCCKDSPFERVNKIDLPSDVAETLEDFKLSIVRHRACGFENCKQHEFLAVLNALRHFVLMDGE